MLRIEETLGDKIKRYRMSIKMTQSDFAQRLGVTGASVSAYENGLRQPSYEVLVKIANILCTTTDNLLGRVKHEGKTVDVTLLSDEQLKLVNSLIASFVERNELYQLAADDGRFDDQLREILHQ